MAILGVGGWFGYSYYSGGKHQLEELNQQLEARHQEVAKLTDEVKAKDRDIQRLERELQRLQIANRLLKVNQRVAQVNVVSQTGSAKAGDLATTFTFQKSAPTTSRSMRPASSPCEGTSCTLTPG